MGSSPSRIDVAAQWMSVVAGTLTREEAHAWTLPWVEGDDTGVYDPMVLNGLQHLHGLGLKHDPMNPGLVSHGRGPAYVQSDLDVVEALAHWQADCARFDANPVEYVKLARARANACSDET